MTKDDEKSKIKLPHCLTLDNRKNLILSGVLEVDSFDDKSVTAYTELGELSIKGESLNIKKLNLELGELEVEGYVSSLNYSDNQRVGNLGFFSRLFR